MSQQDSLTARPARSPGPAFPWLRPFVRWLRHGPDRLLHPVRRRWITRRLAGRRAPVSVLFVCYGNICRSPYAAGAFRQLAGGATHVSSAGMIGPGRPAPAEAARAAAAHGIDLVPHRSTQLTRELIAGAELVVVMDERQRHFVQATVAHAEVLLLGDLDPLPITTRAIIDPIDQPSEVYDRVYARIGRCVRALAHAVYDGRPDAGAPNS